jgi:DNA-binding CsgD family transcriptional regulator
LCVSVDGGGVCSRSKAGQATRGPKTLRSTIEPGTRLRGRGAECERLDRLISDARGGTSGALVVRGEAGVGKTALLDYLLAHAAGCRIARAAGVESEMELPYAGLHQFCGPFLDRLEHLPEPQRDALGTAFGLRIGEPPERFMVGLAVLSLLSDVAEAQPLVCLVDDAQWLDRASTQVLGFVARRLAAESVVILFGVREPAQHPDLAGLPELMIGPLRVADARALLASVIPGKLDESVRDRIVAEARGNPLALVELPRAWTLAAFAGGFGLPDAASVAGRIEESFRRRLTPLPDDGRQLLLVAAAEPVGNPALVWAAAERLGIAAGAAGPAIAAGLLDDGPQLGFRHPLVRSVVYQEASLEDRRLVHAALAEETDPGLDPDRRAWHLAAAAAGPDEAVAAELERSAGRAQARGGVAAAAAFLQRAVGLTRDPARRAERALAAAQASLQAGSFDAAQGLLVKAEAGALNEFQRALIDLMRAQLAFASSRGNEATTLLLAAARRLEPLNLKLARETYLDAFSAALFGARLNEDVGVAEVAATARAAPRPPSEEATSADLLLDGLVALVDGYDKAIASCREALQKLSSDTISPGERLRWLWQGGVIALELWDDENAFSLSQRGVQIARETGTLSELALALSAHIPVLVFCGEISDAVAGVAETQAVEDATGVRSAPYGALILAAWRGEEGKSRELIKVTNNDAGARGEGIGIAVSEYARAVLCNGLGQYEEALAAAVSASEYREAVVENWGLSELVEPASRTGRIDLATDALSRLAAKARATGTAWALGIEARSRALLSRDDIADSLFRDAIGHLNQSRVRSERARTHLLYGEFLRRSNRRVDARRELNTAHEMFSAMGMEGFAERARHELLATGERVRKRGVETRDELTPQEEQIARLAGDGHSNVEIGARLFLSPRTVEWHLRKVFGKLGVSSRKELRQALSAEIQTGIGA